MSVPNQIDSMLDERANAQLKAGGIDTRVCFVSTGQYREDDKIKHATRLHGGDERMRAKAEEILAGEIIFND